MNADDLYELLQNAGVQRLRRSGSNLYGCCPFHDERTPSWGVSINEPHCHACFACNARGTLADLLIRVCHFSESKARQYANIQSSDLRLPALSLGKLKRETETLEPHLLYPFRFTRRLTRYLKKRGIGPLLARKLGCVDNHNDDRLMFPWYYNGELVGVTGRTLIDDSVKTLPYFGTKKGDCFYLPQGRISGDMFIIVEGEIDAIKIYNAGYRNVGAISFGQFTYTQAQLILNSNACSVVIATDDDETGRKLKDKIAQSFKGKKRLYGVDFERFRKRYPEDKLDPGHLKLSEIRELIVHKYDLDALKIGRNKN